MVEKSFFALLLEDMKTNPNNYDAAVIE